MKNGTTSWRVSDKVWIQYLDKLGKLTVGYTLPYGVYFGPELGFGHVVEEAAKNGTDIFLVKIAWKEARLAVEYRPFSSGERNYTHNCTNNSSSSDGCIPYDSHDYHFFYVIMVDIIKEVLQELVSINPDWTSYELGGLVWLQGVSDYHNAAMCREYRKNLANFIHDIRASLDQPRLPVVVGELGIGGNTNATKNDTRLRRFREHQRSVTQLPPLRSNTKFVPTSVYTPPSGEEAVFDSIDHYYGRADTFYLMGRSFGQAMLDLQRMAAEQEAIRLPKDRPISTERKKTLGTQTDGR